MDSFPLSNFQIMKYQKRIHWDRHRPEFLKLGFIFALAITLMAFNYTSSPPVFEPLDLEPLSEDLLIIPPTTTHQKKVPLPPPPPPKITAVVDIEPTTDPIVKFENKTDFEDKTKVVIDDYANDPAPEPAPIVELVIEDTPKETGPVLMAERMPIYGSCDMDSEENLRRDCTNQNLINHIYENVKYPPIARGNGIEGTVVVSFIVNKEGYVEDVEILRNIGSGCGKEVKRVINKLGRFLPGKQNGRPVSVIYRMPVKFNLQ